MASDDIAKAVRDARAAAVVAFGCLILLGVLLMVDGQRNKIMLQHVMEARRILDEFRGAVSQAVSDAAAETGTAPTVGGDPAGGGGTGGDSASSLVADAIPGAGMDQAGSPAEMPGNGTAGRRAGMAGGPRGDG